MTQIFNQNVLQALDAETQFNYTKVCNYIQQFLSRDDQSTIDNIPTFIALAEQRLAVDLKFLAGVQVNQFTINASTPEALPCSVIIKKPTAWRETKSMSFVNTRGRSYVYPRSYEYLQTFLSDFSLVDLEAQNNFEELVFYADYDNYNWIFGPYRRDINYLMEVLYFSTIPTLNSTNQENYWTQLAPRALIYAALYEADYFLRSDDRTTNSWTQNYQEAIANLAKQNSATFTDNTIQRTN